MSCLEFKKNKNNQYICITARILIYE